MTKPDSLRPTLQALEEKLDRLCSGAAPDDVIDDTFVDALMEWLGPGEPLSHEATHFAVTQLQAALKDEAAVAEIRQGHLRATQEKTVGQVMNEVRTKAGWTLGAVAQRVEGDTALIERLEADLVPIGQVAVRQLANLLETFHMRLKDFIRLAQHTARAQQLQRMLRSSHARSKTDPNSAQHARDLAFAIANAMPNLDKAAKPPPLDPNLVDGLVAELTTRRRTDLLNG